MSSLVTLGRNCREASENTVSGYDGYSKSNNALSAAAEGKLPLSRAIVEVAKLADCTQRTARAALVHVGPCEWHHTSKRYNRTNYYKVASAVRYLAARPVIASLPCGWQQRMDKFRSLPVETPDRIEQIDAADCALAAELGVPVEILECEYYDAW
jgi:hypothetical protein